MRVIALGVATLSLLSLGATVQSGGCVPSPAETIDILDSNDPNFSFLLGDGTDISADSGTDGGTEPSTGVGFEDEDGGEDGNPSAPLYVDDFEDDEPIESSFPHWVSTGANNSLERVPSLYRTMRAAGSRVFGTTDTSYNTHAHFIREGTDQWKDYQFSGRMLRTSTDGGMGVTFYSAYTQADRYYRLRVFGNNTFELAAHGTSLYRTSDISANRNVWYRFRIQVRTGGDRTFVRAKVWAEGSAEPSDWQLEADDPTGSRRRAGTIGVWSMAAGAKYFDDFEVLSLDPDADAPTANAGADQTLLDSDDDGAEQVQLDASASKGQIDTYIWKEGDTTLSRSSSATTTVSLPVGSHKVILTVIDSIGAIDRDTVVITVNAPANKPPTADAGADQSLTDSDGDGSATVSLDGRGSRDSDGTIVKYTWTEGSVIRASTSSSTVNVALGVGKHTIDLIVTDNDGATASDQVIITVKQPANAPPVADAGPNRVVTDDSGSGSVQVTLDGSGSSDSDGSIATYIWRDGSTTLAITATPTVNVSLALGNHSIVLTVTDDDNASASDEVLIDVKAALADGVLFADDFQSYSTGADLLDWEDTGANNSLSSAPGLYTVMDTGGSMALGTSDTQFNTHSHYSAAGSDEWSNYEFRGRMMRSSTDGGMGVTVLSGYPDADRYYRLRVYSTNAFELTAHGTSLFAASSVTSSANVWYQFRLQVEDTGSSTWVRATVWPDGSDEPAGWQMEAEDAASTRLSSGTIGIWTMSSGAKYVDDLHVETLSDPGTPVADAGADQTLIDTDNSGSESVTLDGIDSSDGNGSIVNYHWAEGSTVFADGSNAGVTVSLATGLHTITLTVTDNDDLSASDTTIVSINSPLTPGCDTSSSSWQNSPIGTYTGVFTCEYDATPGSAGMDGIFGLSAASGLSYVDFAVLVRFTTSGKIDARNGGSYAADASIPYSAGQSYHFRLVVDVPNHIYSVYVTPAGGSEQLLASNFAFRTEQASITSVTNCGLIATGGTHEVCNLAFAGGGNQPPLANAGSNQTVLDADDNGSESVTVNGSGSLDYDGSIVNYRWAEGSTVLSDGTNSALTTTLSTGSHTLTLTVRDDAGAEASDSLTVTITTAGGATMMSSVSQYGITWTFDGSYPVGQFANGDYWVVGPISVVSITKTHSNQGLDGSMVNPIPSLSHGYDSRVPGYSASLNASLSLPLALGADSSLVSTISWETGEPGAPTATRPWGPRPALRKGAVLTVLGTAPPEGTLRPPYSGTDKPLHNIASLRRDLLPKLPKVSNTPTFASVQSHLQKPWLDNKLEWTGDDLHPSENMPNYGRNLASRVHAIGLMLMLDIPDAEKEVLLIQFVQVGIDFHGNVANGAFYGTYGGGIGVGRKWPILLAGVLLNDPDMMSIGTTYGTSIFQEDCQTFYVTQADRDRFPTIFPTLGAPAWGERHCSAPWNDDVSRGYRTCCTANAWGSAVLGARIMGVVGLWNHDALFDYQDNYMCCDYYGVGTWQRSWSRFSETMWDTYRSDY